MSASRRGAPLAPLPVDYYYSAFYPAAPQRGCSSRAETRVHHFANKSRSAPAPRRRWEPPGGHRYCWRRRSASVRR